MNATVDEVVNATLNEALNPKRTPTPFHWSAWVVAIFCVFVVICVKLYVRNLAGKHLEIDIVKEMRKRDGVYRREDYEADTKNGALQTCKKDEDGLISLKLIKRTKVTHDTYYFR